MKKNILKTIVSFAAVVAIASCGSGSGYSTDVLEDSDVAGYYITGPSTITVGGKKAGEWGIGEGGKMTATSLAEVAKVSEDVAKTLSERKVKGLYMVTDVVLGVGENTNKVYGYKDGKCVVANQTLTFKFISSIVDEETQQETLSSWYSSAEQHCETLTADTLWVAGHSDTADEYGLDHNANPAVIGGAGTYTGIFAIYSTAYEGSVAGLGMVLTKANPNGEQFVEYVPSTEVKVGLIGTFNEWGGDVFLTKGDGDTYTTDYEFAADAEFKVRLNEGWTVSFGYEALTEKPTYLEDNGGNIKVKEAGTYTVSITLSGNSATAFTVTKK